MIEGISITALVLALLVLCGNACAVWWLYQRQERQEKRLQVHARRIKRLSIPAPRPAKNVPQPQSGPAPALPEPGKLRPPTIPEWRAGRKKLQESE